MVRSGSAVGAVYRVTTLSSGAVRPSTETDNCHPAGIITDMIWSSELHCDQPRPVTKTQYHCLTDKSLGLDHSHCQTADSDHSGAALKEIHET